MTRSQRKKTEWCGDELLQQVENTVPTSLQYAIVTSYKHRMLHGLRRHSLIMISEKKHWTTGTPCDLSVSSLLAHQVHNAAKNHSSCNTNDQHTKDNASMRGNPIPCQRLGQGSFILAVKFDGWYYHIFGRCCGVKVVSAYICDLTLHAKDCKSHMLALKMATQYNNINTGYQDYKGASVHIPCPSCPSFLIRSQGTSIHIIILPQQVNCVKEPTRYPILYVIIAATRHKMSWSSSLTRLSEGHSKPNKPACYFSSQQGLARQSIQRWTIPIVHCQVASISHQPKSQFALLDDFLVGDQQGGLLSNLRHTS